MQINVPMMGEKAPAFTARTTQGDINFPSDYAGRWVIMYVYIGDFLPVSALDIMAFDKAMPKFSSYNADVIAMSADSIADHLAWIRQLRNMRSDGKCISFPLISDRNFEISKKYGIINSNSDTRTNESAILIIDSEGVLRSAYRYSVGVGVNICEIERTLLALQTSCYQYAQVSGNWTPGDDILEYPPQTVSSMNFKPSECEASGGRCVDWYICYRADSGLRCESPTAIPSHPERPHGGHAFIG